MDQSIQRSHTYPKCYIKLINGNKPRGSLLIELRGGSRTILNGGRQLIKGALINLR